MKKRVLATALCCLWALCFQASAQEPACPESITVDEKLAKEIAGWEPVQADLPHVLVSVRFFEGHPTRQVELSPVADAADRDGTARWEFVPDGRPYYLSCSYAATGITLNRSLDPSIGSCVVVYHPNISIEGHALIRSLRCGSKSSNKVR